jgi:hypothetical protein
MTAGKITLVSNNRSIKLDIIHLGIEQKLPKFSFFDTVYRRHTNFGKDNKQLTVDTTADFGNTVTLSFQEIGDLVGDIYLEVTLPPATSCFVGDGGVMPAQYANWTNAVGFAMIEQAKFSVNNVVVDRQSGLWFDIQNELTDPNRKEWPLVGKVDDPLKLKFFQTKSTKYIIPLKFSFNKSPGQALPIFLTGTDTKEFKIDITFRELNNLLLHDGGTLPDPRTATISDFKAYATYYSLENDEILRIKDYRNKRQYSKGDLIHLIETVQPFSPTNSGDYTFNAIDGSIKELLWVFQHDDRISTSNPIIRDNVALNTHCGNDHFNYSSTSNLTINGTEFDTLDPFGELIISIGNSADYEKKNAFYYRQYLPYKHHSNVPNNYVYSFPFCLHPEEYQPSGTINISRNNTNIKFNFLNSIATDYKIKLFAVSYRFLKMNTNKARVEDIKTFTDNEYEYKNATSRESPVETDETDSSVDYLTQIKQQNVIIKNQQNSMLILNQNIITLNNKIDDLKMETLGKRRKGKATSTIAGTAVQNFFVKQ